jgi:hypothetical protein
LLKEPNLAERDTHPQSSAPRARTAPRAALQKRHDVLAHPGAAHLERDAIGAFRAREVEYQDRVLSLTIATCAAIPPSEIPITAECT